MPIAKSSRHRLRKQPTQARAVATVDAILGATARILVRRGYAALTTNHVAVAAGVSVGTLYEWFPGKEALVAALVDRHLARAEALLGEKGVALAGDAHTMSLCALGTALSTVMVELHEDVPRLHRVLTEEVPHPAATRARVRGLEDRMIEVLSNVLARHPAVRARDPSLAARMIVGLLEAATHRWAIDPSGAPIPRDVLVEELATMVEGYLVLTPRGR